MKLPSAILLLCLAAGAYSFGVPEPPEVLEVPDVELPDIEIPGLDILSDLKLQLDELILSTEGIREIIPELSVLEDVSAQLGELSETGVPGVTELRAEIDALTAELEAARGEITQYTELNDGDLTEVKTRIDTFVDGLPLPQ